MRDVVLMSVLFFCLAALGCREAQKPHAELRILRSRELRTLPSASGITASGNLFVVHADNAPFLYILDAAGSIIDSLPLLHENPLQHEIPKPVKSDYEAASVVRFDGHDGLLLLGSGSMSPHRDSALLIQQRQRKATLRPFYDALIRSGIAAKKLNIEAAASHGNVFVLFNRGSNAIITVDCDSFLNAVFDAAPLPVFEVQQVVLPAVKGFSPGISGATMLNDSIVLFCGSVEATTDWAKDGEILGSGIGILRLAKDGLPELLRWTMLKDPEGQLMRKKLEGIEVLREDPGILRLRCVTDNDKGGSEVFDIGFPLPPNLRHD